MDFLKSQSSLADICPCYFLRKTYLPDKLLQITVLTELKKYIEMGEVLKTGIGLNNEWVFYICEYSLLGLDVSLQIIFY